MPRTLRKYGGLIKLMRTPRSTHHANVQPQHHLQTTSANHEVNKARYAVNTTNSINVTTAGLPEKTY
ncbi:hypothetical protein HZ326_23957 [Fusarium oxysporum f. sp. albedinis]|nr:hypothetical protein HZ326_23957 [Fusarium oxysporum f. sp. albedinis]